MKMHKKKIFFKILLFLVFLSACASTQSLKQDDIVATSVAGTLSVISSHTFQSTQSPTAVQYTIEDGNFSGVSVQILDKINKKGDIIEFIVLPFKVVNNYDKNIKGIEGILHVRDMFGKDILDIQWDITLGVIPAHGSITENEFGISYNPYIDTHQKVYNTAYEDLIFEYEFMTIMFSDGTTITADN